MAAYFYTPASNAAAGGSLWMEARGDGSIVTSLWKMSNGATAKMYVPACTARKQKVMRPLGSRADNYPSALVVTTMFSLQWLTPKHSLKFCAYCYTSNAKKLCSCCGEARYCSRACFSKHWQEHRHVCNWSAETLLKKIQTFGGADTIIKVGKVRQKVVKYIVQDWAPRLTELVFLCKLGEYDLYMDQGIAAAYTSEMVFGDPTCAVMYNSVVSKIADVQVFGPILAKKHVEREQRADPCAICLEDLTVGEVNTLACGHSFHRDCMTGALKRGHLACPLCRAGLDATDRGKARKHTDMYTQEHVVVRRIMMNDTSIVPSSLNHTSSIRMLKVPMCPGAARQPPFYGMDVEKLMPLWERLKKPPRTRAMVIVFADIPYYAMITNIKIKEGFDPITLVPPVK